MNKSAEPLKLYACGPLRFDDDDYYDRHLVFDHVVPSEEASPRERFEAMARSVRDVLAQRWILTHRSYDHQNPKEVYYLSMEFLIGRTLANAITNLQIEDFVRKATSLPISARTGRPFSRRSPTPGWATVAWAGWPPAFSTRWPRSQIPAVGYGLRYEYGMFRQEIKDGRQVEHPDNWLLRARPVGGGPAGRNGRGPAQLRVPDEGGAADRGPERADVVRRHSLRSAGRRLRRRGPSTRLRLWGAAAHEDFNFLEFSRGDFFDAVHEKVAAEVLTRVLYPDDSTPRGPEPPVRPGVLPGRLLAGRHRARGSAAGATTGRPFPTRPPSSSTTLIPRWPSPS